MWLTFTSAIENNLQRYGWYQPIIEYDYRVSNSKIKNEIQYIRWKYKDQSTRIYKTN